MSTEDLLKFSLDNAKIVRFDKFIDKDQLISLSENILRSGYGEYLQSIIKESESQSFKRKI